MEGNWINIQNFIASECSWDKDMRPDACRSLCKKYDFVRATVGWVLPDYIKALPMLAYEPIHKDKPNIQALFNHYYSFLTQDNDLYWVVSPDYCGMDKEEIIAALNENYLVCDIVDGLRSSYSLVFKPINIMLAYNKYTIKKTGRKQYELRQINEFLSIDEVIKTFTTQNEAEAFMLGFDTAFAQAVQMFTK